MKITGKTAIEIADNVRALVQRDALRAGDALPPVRELAETLQVNRNTVAAAYQRLVHAGIAVSQGRLGTSICRPQGAGEQEGISKGTTLVDLADGNPSPAWLPDPRALLETPSSARLRAPTLYGDDTVLPELRAIGDAWLGIDCPRAWTLELAHGAVDAVERLAAAHLTAGDKVAVEDPGYLGTFGALRAASMRLVGVSLDDAGMRPESLQAALESGVRAVLLTPRAQNPTGCNLTKRRAGELKKLLSDFPAVLVIVDDHYALLGETPYHSVIPASTQRWALVRSASKGFGPDLRAAFVACDANTGERLRTRLAPGMNWVSHILQTIFAAGMASDDVRRKMAGARDDYASRREALRSALATRGFELPAAGSGYNLWIPVPRDAKDVAYALAKMGWLVRVGSTFDVQGQSQAIRVTVSRLEPDAMQRFAADLRASVE